MTGERLHLERDWFARGIPANVVIGKDVFIDTSYAFAGYLSQRAPGLALGEASGVYDRATLLVGPEGQVTVGAYTCLNGATLLCRERLGIGAHCFLAWGCVITDTWLTPKTPPAARRAFLRAAARNPERGFCPGNHTAPVELEDNVWVGFDSVILPGVRLGRGCIVGCKTVIQEDVPPYAVVAGDPPRLVRSLEPNDTEAARRAALEECRHG